MIRRFSVISILPIIQSSKSPAFDPTRPQRSQPWTKKSTISSLPKFLPIVMTFCFRSVDCYTEHIISKQDTCHRVRQQGRIRGENDRGQDEIYILHSRVSSLKMAQPKSDGYDGFRRAGMEALAHPCWMNCCPSVSFLLCHTQTMKGTSYYNRAEATAITRAMTWCGEEYQGHRGVENDLY